ncbi:3-oxoadipate enol-lactonase [Azospirillum sp. RWY-5-1]|uniref:3-oxoadipate enol-lactonase n=1 Tax=Azospirillum oleiclasticum TaxID=2735135 RepID=A0ABX2T6J9_9PROT|nr:3-oxoadipate enol-lactonase [Azospirillum oleiclasticum]NYZ12656.1 3-oxoadipate enol-lactonase [Azospirillum oleiclasticum]NYZ19816.1 3-oxoadipate enol-lactonase [Azospirillum oleiclasticum]
MKAVSNNDIVIRYREDGRRDGPVLLFSNSLGTDLQVWDKVVPAFTGDFRVLRYDTRGHGLSDAPAAPYSLDDHVGDMLAVMDDAGVERAILVGLSVGGLIAQGVAARAPERVRALVLSNTAHRIGSVESWTQRMDAISAGGIASIADAILERWFSAAFRRERAAELAVWRNMLVRTPAQGYLGTCAALRDGDLTAAAARIAVPTLCLAGSEDGATPPDLVRSTAGLIPGARFHLIDGAGHIPGVENPEAVIAAIRTFLKENDLV